MLKELLPEQRGLAEYMSKVSEIAWSAGWMDDLEFALWEIAQGKRTQYGRLTVTGAHRRELKSLSDRAGGWIVFEDDRGKTFVPRLEWGRRFAEKASVAEDPSA